MAFKLHKKVKIRIMLALMLAILISLGVWQVQRLAWKEALIARMDAQTKAAPAALPSAAVADPAEWEYRRARVEGKFDPKHIFWVRPRTENGVVGAHMLVWLKRRGWQPPVLINRGFVPDSKVAEMTVPEGMVALEGVVQIPHKSYFTPDNNPAKNDWYWADIPAMAEAAGYDGAMPMLVTLPPVQGSYPSGFAVTAHIRNNHLQYALFWFSMAAILLVVFTLSQREKPAPRPKPE